MRKGFTPSLRILVAIIFLVLMVAFCCSLYFRNGSSEAKALACEEYSDSEVGEDYLRIAISEINSELEAEPKLNKLIFVSLGVRSDTNYVCPTETILRDLGAANPSRSIRSVSECLVDKFSGFQDKTGERGVLVNIELKESTDSRMIVDFHAVTGPLGGHSREGIVYERVNGNWVRSFDGTTSIH